MESHFFYDQKIMMWSIALKLLIFTHMKIAIIVHLATYNKFKYFKNYSFSHICTCNIRPCKKL